MNVRMDLDTEKAKDMVIWKKIMDCLGCVEPTMKPGFEWKVGPVQELNLGEAEMKSIVLTATQRVKITIGNPLDRRGNPATMDGEPRLESGDESIVKVYPAGGTKEWWIEAVGPVDDATVVDMVGDALLGEEVEEIRDPIMVGVAGGKLAGFGVSIGSPEEIPDQPTGEEEGEGEGEGEVVPV